MEKAYAANYLPLKYRQASKTKGTHPPYAVMVQQATCCTSATVDYLDRSNQNLTIDVDNLDNADVRIKHCTLFNLLFHLHCCSPTTVPLEMISNFFDQAGKFIYDDKLTLSVQHDAYNFIASVLSLSFSMCDIFTRAVQQTICTSCRHCLNEMQKFACFILTCTCQ